VLPTRKLILHAVCIELTMFSYGVIGVQNTRGPSKTPASTGLEWRFGGYQRLDKPRNTASVSRRKISVQLFLENEDRTQCQEKR
jgi:hypothetical protein